MKNRISTCGGGVAIMTKNDSSQVEIIHSEINVFDLCSVNIKIDYKIYIFICIYRPPGVNDVSRHDADLLSILLSKLLASKFIFFVAGDLNLPNVNWDLLSAPNDGVHELLHLFIDDCLSQLVSAPTRFNNILDICLTNAPQRVRLYFG